MTPSSPLHTAVVTGAGSGIGRCVALRLARAGAALCLTSRSAAKLEAVKTELAATGADVHTAACDFNTEKDVARLRTEVERRWTALDLLIHCAGVIAIAPLASTSLDAFDRQYRVNVRAPLELTQALLPLLQAARGQIVFVNSSLGVRVKERAGAYAASKHALKAVADTLRAELHDNGVRVLSVFPGNTATEMQQQVCRELGQPFLPDTMLQPDDVAAAIVNALALPPRAALTDLHILPARPAPGA